jgi:hypothetical protein
MQPGEQDLSGILALSEADLFLEIDRQLSPIGFFIDTRAIDKRVESGRNWFQERRARISKNVCSSATLARLREAGDSQGKVALLVALADLIASICIGVSPFTVAAIILKLGLDRFCTGVPIG